jgi:hypothetical protein
MTRQPDNELNSVAAKDHSCETPVTSPQLGLYSAIVPGLHGSNLHGLPMGAFSE